MMELLKKLLEKQGMTEREKVIADYIVHHCEKVTHMTTRELAKNTYTSATVIVRFVKKLGYQGFQDFKLNLLMDLKASHYQDIELKKEDSLVSIINKVSSLHEKALLETKNQLSLEKLEKVRKAFQQVNQIDIFALDANASIGEYMSHNMMQVGKLSHVYQSIDKILLYSSLVQKSVVIVITRMGMDKHLLKAVRSLRMSQHFVIVMCANEKSLLKRNSDVFLLCAYKENIAQLGDPLFHSSISYLFDVFISIIVNDNYDQAMNLYLLHEHLYEY